MKKRKRRKPRKCRVCRKRPVWIGGDVKNPGPVCKRCYHKRVWPDRTSRRKTGADGGNSISVDDFDDLLDYDHLVREDFGLPLDDVGMPLAWSSDHDYFWACIVTEDDERQLLWSSEDEE